VRTNTNQIAQYQREQKNNFRPRYLTSDNIFNSEKAIKQLKLQLPLMNVIHLQ